MNPKLNAISAAVVIALAAASTAHAALERVGPVNNAPTVGGFPAWYQDKTGVAVEFCDPQTQAELDGGWCLLLPGDANIPEAFPANFFDEHFYYAADNNLVDDARAFRGRLVIALESAFANGVAPGEQIVFGRLRIDMRPLPFEGTYRVITPYSDTTYPNLAAGSRIFDTVDIGAGCTAQFDCALGADLGPFLLPSAVAGGAEVPPMPDLRGAPAGTDPFYDAMVAAGAGPTADPGTGKKYVADPARIGAVTGSPLPPFEAKNIDGTTTLRNHNTFRLEVSDAAGNVFYTLDGENNFAVVGRLMAGTLPGKLDAARASYKADGSGNITALDVFAKASATSQARIPGQAQVPAVAPVLNFYDQACGGALVTDPATGETKVTDGPYTAPASPAHPMAKTGSDYWGQSQPGGLPPAYSCIEDTTARNASGQVVPAYYLRAVTDEVVIGTATYNGQNNGTLSVTAVSSDPTAVLTLAGYGVDLNGGTASVAGLQAPASRVQVASNKGGVALRNTDTGQGSAAILGVPSAVADSTTIVEDATATTLDLLANDTILLNGTLTTLRNVVDTGLGTVTVAATAPRLGTASVDAAGILTYTPNANANGSDQVSYTVTVDGKASNQSTATINITAVNDAPVAGNTTVGAVVGKQNLTNLIASATDVDGNQEVRDAVITAWPAALGVQPGPVNGVISFAPTAAGTYTFAYQVKDAAGAVSANQGTGTVNVALNEIITFGKHQFAQQQNRWVVDGTDNIIQGQTITVVYENGWLVGAAAPCDGTTANPNCVVATALVDGVGAWGFDTRNNTGRLNPKAGASIWQQAPTHIRAFSTLPSLGGTVAIDIVFK